MRCLTYVGRPIRIKLDGTNHISAFQTRISEKEGKGEKVISDKGGCFPEGLVDDIGLKQCISTALNQLGALL